MGVVTIKMKSKPFIFELIISSWLLISRASIFIEITSSFRFLISSFWLSIWRFRDSIGRFDLGLISGHPVYERWNSKNWVLYRKLTTTSQKVLFLDILSTSLPLTEKYDHVWTLIFASDFMISILKFKIKNIEKPVMIFELQFEHHSLLHS